ncbi:hypothetical protein FJY90_01925 [Candidatus Gottesmanbacteria bacterium]|nr:hypothetical protein [Candidatus Gottesmanbacteria bacterium]
MTYITITGDYTSSIWFKFYLDGYSDQLNLSKRVETSFSPTTDWEKVFALGDEINKGLDFSERNIMDEIASYRKSKKKSSR